ncbi:hypothetical protein AAG570_009380 [Ranatra chinensis]|uniref:Serpin domain-containing protein n=1 Tax=Ranatra chinensis TaxID=642074 RepID=A0ABD0ZC77_9HEMI
MGATEGGAQKALELLIEGSNKFALDLFKAVAKNNTDNIIVSPTSLMIVLSLAYTGARGLTAKEMSDVLGLPSSMEDVLIGCNQLLKDLQHPVLKLANKMFVDESMQLKEEFQKNALEYFLASAAQVDFGKSEEARQTINSWVEDNTNNKIKDLFKPGTLDSSSVLVLVNAIHFKAKWLYPFDSEMTEKEKFYVTPDTTVDVDMMSARDKFLFKHNEELGAKMLVLPYEGDDFHMVIILPDAKDGLAAVEEKLHTLDLAKEIPTFQNITVSLGLPKFKFEKTMDLNEILQGVNVFFCFV